ncbi:MAG: ornithine uptake porin CarO [Acinetobacter haemolyticus]
MKAVRILLSAGILTAIAGTTFAADERIVTDEGVATFSFMKPASVRAEVGTTGYGGAISYNANPYVGVTLGYNGGDISWSDDLKINGSKYDLDMDNNNVYLNAEIRPWANWFYVATGVAYVDNDYGLERRAGQNASFKVDGARFANPVGTTQINGTMKYKNDIVPYLGVGFSPAITNRWGVFGEVGAYYTGNPTVNLSTDAASSLLVGDDGRTLGTAIKDEEHNIANKSKYEWMPVAKLGLSFRF